MHKQTAVNNSGQALVELILAIALASLFLTSFVLVIISVRESFNRASLNLAAKNLLQQEVEALRSIKETGWNSFATAGTYHVVQSGNSWTVAPGTALDNNLTHGFTVSNVCRQQTTGPIVDCSSAGAIVDPSVKKIAATVSWSFLGTESLTNNLYLTRNFNNSTVVQTTPADFNPGTKVSTVVTNTAGGEVQLSPSATTSDYGNKFLITSIGSVGNMTNKTLRTSLRFTAQASKAVSAVRVYLNAAVGTSPSYRYGIQADVAGQPSGTFLGSGLLQATAAGWQTVPVSPAVLLTQGTVYHLVVQWFSGVNNNSRYISLRESRPLNALYPLNNNPDAAANTLFYNGTSWVLRNAQPIYVLNYSDGSFEGNPYYLQTEIGIFGNRFVGEKFKTGATALTATQISFYVRRNGTPSSNLTVDLWNADSNSLVEQITQPTVAIPTSYAYLTYNFAASRVLAANTNYRIYLKSPGSTFTNGYRVRVLQATNAANYNGLTYDGTNSIYTLSGNAGGSWIDTNLNMDIGGFRFTIQTSGMANSGTFESATISAPQVVSFNYFSFTNSVPANTSLRFQVASNSDNVTWNYAGPDGSSATYFDTPGPVSLAQVSGRYFRYKGYFTGNGQITPVLYDATLNYSP